MDWQAMFSWIESTAFSTWVRESPSMLAFPAVLAVHAIGMAFLVGACTAMDLRILGFAPRVRLSSTDALLPIIQLGFWMNAISGVVLLIGFPTKHLTNPLFYIKLSLIAAAVIDTGLILRHVVRKPPPEGIAVPMKGRLLACASLIFWAGSVISGRLLYYTFTRLDSFGIPYVSKGDLRGGRRTGPTRSETRRRNLAGLLDWSPDLRPVSHLLPTACLLLVSLVLNSGDGGMNSTSRQLGAARGLAGGEFRNSGDGGINSPVPAIAHF